MDPIERLKAALTGRYRIERELGAGGMATVYLAEDLRHEREVAIKVLHPDLAAALGGERFLAEIKTTARLNHPHILPLLDSGNADGFLFYAMPHVQGETLRSRLSREQQLPVDDALRIAREVADALMAAHHVGIIHRDIKPENILLQGGHALVADFGIALAVQSAGGARMTQTGLSLGTPQYMSPEQAMGERTIDARADQYALAVVTYEMLAGEPPFTGPTVQAIIAKALSERPVPLATLRDTVPAGVEQAVMRALAKRPADRFTTVQEFAAALRLDGATESHATATGSATGAERLGRSVGSTRRWQLIAAAFGTVAVAATVQVVRGSFSEGKSEASPGVVRAYLDLPADQQIATAIAGTTIAVSPDGGVIAYTATSTGGFRLYVRRVNELAPRSIGSASIVARNLTFSPDGNWLAYTEGNALRKIAIDGGDPVTLGSTGGSVPYGLSWAASDTIRIGSYAGLFQLPASGGTTSVVPRADSAQARLGLRWPLTLADGRSVLVVRGNNSSSPGQLSHFDLRTGRVTHHNLQVSVPVDIHQGRLVYVSAEGALMTVPIDLGTAAPTGAPELIDGGLFIDATNGAKIALSRSGTLVYLKGLSGQVQPVLVTPGTSAAQPLVDELRGYFYPRFSPNGRHVAFSVQSATATDIWVYDVARRTSTRLTSSGTNSRPEWTPDGRTILYLSDQGGEMAIWSQPADGSATPRMLYKPPLEPFEVLVSPDAKWLVYRTAPGMVSPRDIFAVPFEGDRSTITPLVTGPETESMPRFSPDGRWLAYQSNDGGRFDIYVRPFPEAGGRLQVSTDGGTEPLWGRDGRALYYRGPAGEVMKVNVTTGASFSIGSRRVAATGDYLVDATHPSWDVAPDGRFLMLRRSGEPARAVIVHNWTAELAGGGPPR